MPDNVDMWDLIARNKRNTVMLISSFILFMGVLGYTFGAVYGQKKKRKEDVPSIRLSFLE